MFHRHPVQLFYYAYYGIIDLTKARYKPHLPMHEIQALKTDQEIFLTTQNDKKAFVQLK